MKERSALEASLTGRCPRCREGEMFITHPYKIPGFMKMNSNCPHCGLHFEREPGFWYGAMYVSYAINVAIFISTWVAITVLGDDPPLSMYLIAVVLVAFFLYPINFRYSRIIFLHVFGGFKYDPKFK